MVFLSYFHRISDNYHYLFFVSVVFQLQWNTSKRPLQPDEKQGLRFIPGGSSIKLVGLGDHRKIEIVQNGKRNRRKNEPDFVRRIEYSCKGNADQRYGRVRNIPEERKTIQERVPGVEK